MNDRSKSAPSDLYIYILECENGAYYTGYTKNVPKRYQQHVAGTANARYTRSFKPTRMVQCWHLLGEIGRALQIERWIKRQPRKKKELLIQQPELLQELIKARLKIEVSLVPCLTAVTDRSLAAAGQ